MKPPCIPYFGQYLTDIVFTEEGNPNFTQEGNIFSFLDNLSIGLVNWSKRTAYASLLKSLQFFQSVSYSTVIDDTTVSVRLNKYLNNVSYRLV